MQSRQNPTIETTNALNSGTAPEQMHQLTSAEPLSLQLAPQSIQAIEFTQSSAWTLSETELQLEASKGLDQHNTQTSVRETLFSVGNGYIGSRANVVCASIDSANSTQHCVGTYLNGVYTRSKIVYGESAYGFATHNHQLFRALEAKCAQLFYRSHVTAEWQALHVTAQSHTYCMASACHKQTLTLRGTSTTDTAIEVTAQILLFADQIHGDVLHQQWQILRAPENGELRIAHQVESLDILEAQAKTANDIDDPRAGEHVDVSLINLTNVHVEKHASQPALHVTQHIADVDIDVITSVGITSTVAHSIEILTVGEQRFVIQQTLPLTQQPPTTQHPLVIDKIIRYQDTRRMQYVTKGASRFTSAQAAYTSNQAHFTQFWSTADMQITLADAQDQQRYQQALRYHLLQLYTSTGRDGYNNIAAKGVTGPGYDGHYFWDSEIFILPFFLFTQPDIAKQLLRYRISILDAARERAQMMGHTQGALIPWRTIGGEECSAYYPAGTAQYHINAAIAYALEQYWLATHDQAFFMEGGAELLFESAQLWPSLAHASPAGDGHFFIDAVTGPDEYTAVVNNNLYTNRMAQHHLHFAVTMYDQLSREAPEYLAQLSAQIKINQTVRDQWEHIADNLYLPYDDKQQIQLQDDSFLRKKRWDFEHTPAEKYPLLLHFHPLVIYRHQVIKQADVILANVLLPQATDNAQKIRDLAFYEPLTTHDSTLSACVHSIAYADVDDAAQAFAYFHKTLFTDLENKHHNTHYGIHTANMGGTWLSLVRGFSGVRVDHEGLHIKPQLPDAINALSFCLVYQNEYIDVAINTNTITLKRRDAEHTQTSINIYLHQQHNKEVHNVSLKPKQSVTFEITDTAPKHLKK